MADRLCGDKTRNNMTIALNLYLCAMNGMTYHRSQCGWVYDWAHKSSPNASKQQWDIDGLVVVPWKETLAPAWPLMPWCLYWHMFKFSHSMKGFPISAHSWDCLPKPDHLYCSKKHVLRFTGIPISFDFYVSSSVPFPHLLKEDVFSDMKCVVWQCTQ